MWAKERNTREFTYLQYCAFRVVELSHMAQQTMHTFLMSRPKLTGEHGNALSVAGFAEFERKVFVLVVDERIV